MPKNGYSRRDFLKIVGATTGAAAVSCSQQPVETIIPYINQPDESIPGVATWYSGACSACAAGCGVLVRTREGRAVKVEGNPEHPVNRGGLCAQGQAALQGLYDPDRIREPLRREANGSFVPISWEEAITTLSEKFSALNGDTEGVLLTSSLTGSLSSLVDEFVNKIPLTRHVEFDLFNHATLDAAAAQCFGSGYRTRFDFSKAQTIVSIGAGFLETWLSPVEFAAGWSTTRRRAEKLSYVAHIEPRLSLTGANADRWIANRPGSEAQVLLALLKIVIEKSDRQFPDRNSFIALSQGLELTKLCRAADVEEKVLRNLGERLVASPSSLVVAGGVTTTGSDSVQVAVLANLLNVVLGNIGKTVYLVRPKKSQQQASYEQITQLVSQLQAAQAKKIGVLLISGLNPAYALPEKLRFKEALAKVGYLVSVSTHLDETAVLANLVLPLSTSFEAWMDSEPVPGVFNLNQPAMQSLYQTQSLGDNLIAVAARCQQPLGEVSSFYDYLRLRWKERLGESQFEDRWLECVEKGGEWASRSVENYSGNLMPEAFRLKVSEAEKPKFMVLAFPSINSFDGSAANKPWLQELPNPLTTAVWGSWIEIHPDTASHFQLKAGDVGRVRTEHGLVEAPVYITTHIHRDLIAVPLGQGHETYGRYADGIGINAFRLLSGQAQAGDIEYLTALTVVERGTWKEELVTLQGHDFQYDRGILRSISPEALIEQNAPKLHSVPGASHGAHEKASDHTNDDANKHGAGHGHALGPKPEPPQMYHQMEHPQYQWAMSIDLSSCTGCSACVVACYAENNIPVVGKKICAQGREMSWIRMNRYFDESETQPIVGFMPMMCQHCGNAPCEPVCPVYATYHNDEGLNAMVYNRCVGTRYCSNNCSYKVRRFNWFHYVIPEPLTWQLNPDVTVREVGVMEKCTFCVQRVREAKNNAKNLGRPVQDGEVQPACASSCPTKAISFGNIKDKGSKVYKDSQSNRSYRVLDDHINTQPAVTYLARLRHEEELH